MKKQIFSIMFMLCMVIAFMPFTVFADEGTGDFTVTGGTLNTDYEYADGVLTIKTGTELTIANADGVAVTDNRIEVENGVAANITLAGVNIDTSRTDDTAAFKIAYGSTANVKIILADGKNNILKSGLNCAGLQKNGGTNTGTLTITVPEGSNGTGKLEATGGSHGAGIGGGDIGSGSNITISGGTVTATGYEGGAGIGGGVDGSGSDIKITGGSVKANGTSVTPTLADKTTNVYPLEIDTTGAASVTIDNKTYPVKHEYYENNTKVTENKIYVYLTGGIHTVTIDGKSTKYKFYTDRFLPVPKADDFIFTVLSHDGTKTASVKVANGISGMGSITVNYYDQNGEKVKEVVKAGTYTVRIDVAKGSAYAEATNITDASWKFTVISGTEIIEDLFAIASAKPKIDGDEVNIGWDAIINILKNANDGDTVTIDMNGTSKFPKEAAEIIKGRDIDVVLEMGNGLTWTINGKNVISPRTVDMRVVKNVKKIPVEVINSITGECYSMQLSLAYDGSFGFTATLTIEFGNQNNDMYANLFYYNPKTKEMEFVDYDKIQKGKAELIFSHASEWAIVIDDEPYCGFEDVISAAGVTEASEKLNDDADTSVPAVSIGFAAIIISAAVLVIGKKKNIRN